MGTLRDGDIDAPWLFVTRTRGAFVPRGIVIQRDLMIRSVPPRGRLREAEGLSRTASKMIIDD